MGRLLKLKYALVTLELRILASTSVPFRPTTVQIPNLALIETKKGYQCKEILQIFLQDYFMSFDAFNYLLHEFPFFSLVIVISAL